MAIMLKTEKGATKFNSYYLAVVEKNKLRGKGIKAEIIDEPDIRVHVGMNVEKEYGVHYSDAEKKKLAQLAPSYETKRGRKSGKVWY